MTPAEQLAASTTPEKNCGGIRCNLADIRKKTGLSSTQVWSHLGMSQATYSHIETGRTYPSLTKAIAIAKFFGTTVEAIWPQD